MTAIKIITIVLFFILTIITVHIHPDMHQPILIEPANFKLVRESDYLINRETMPVAKTTATKKDVNIDISSNQTEEKELPIDPSVSKDDSIENIIKITNEKPKAKERHVKTNTDNQLEMLQKFIEAQEQEPVTIEEKPKTHHPQIETKPSNERNIQQPKSKNPYMTEEEEIIAWNKWRSDIQNQIMIDSRIDYAPLGTIFLFSCVIDKYGNVSNIKTWTSNPDYQSIAKEKVKPAIANLQGKPILKFPRGTQRTSTVFNGAFLIGIEDRFSTPNDYADFEKVMRYVQQ